MESNERAPEKLIEDDFHMLSFRVNENNSLRTFLILGNRFDSFPIVSQSSCLSVCRVTMWIACLFDI